jgi:hypothetical protein
MTRGLQKRYAALFRLHLDKRQYPAIRQATIMKFGRNSHLRVPEMSHGARQEGDIHRVVTFPTRKVFMPPRAVIIDLDRL